MARLRRTHRQNDGLNVLKCPVGTLRLAHPTNQASLTRPAILLPAPRHHRAQSRDPPGIVAAFQPVYRLLDRVGTLEAEHGTRRAAKAVSDLAFGGGDDVG